MVILEASIAGGAPQTGGLTAQHGDTVALSLADPSGVKRARWEIWEYPDGFPCPSGWTVAPNGVYYAVTQAGAPPPVFTLPASTSLWGKYFFSVEANDRKANGKIDESLFDSRTAVQILSPTGLRDIGFREGTQFDAQRGWAGELKRIIRGTFGGGGASSLAEALEGGNETGGNGSGNHRIILSTGDYIQGFDSTGGDDGGWIELIGGAGGAQGGEGGSIGVYAGGGGNDTGVGGSIELIAGDGGTGSMLGAGLGDNLGGTVTIKGGNASVGENFGGAIYLEAGSIASGGWSAGGARINILGGDANAGGATLFAGSIELIAGDASSDAGGSIYLRTGNGGGIDNLDGELFFQISNTDAAILRRDRVWWFDDTNQPSDPYSGGVNFWAQGGVACFRTGAANILRLDAVPAATATAGGGEAVPATVAEYVTITLNGNVRKVPLFAA